MRKWLAVTLAAALALSAGLVHADPIPLFNPQQLQVPATAADFNRLITAINAALATVGGTNLPCTPTVSGLVPTPPNDATKFLSGLCTFTSVSGAGIGNVSASGAFVVGELYQANSTNGQAAITAGILAANVVTASGALISGNLMAGGGGKASVDSGILAANVVTAAGVLTSGNLVSGGGSKANVDSGIAATNVVTAASALTSGNLVSGLGGKASADSGVVAANVATAAGALTANQLIVGGAGKALVALGSLGTTTTVYHGNAAGIGSFGPIATADVSNSAITYAKLQNAAASTLLGNPTGSAAAPSEITLGTNLSFAGSVLNAASTSGLSGMTATQIPVANSATTINSSLPTTGTSGATQIASSTSAAKTTGNFAIWDTNKNLVDGGTPPPGTGVTAVFDLKSFGGAIGNGIADDTAANQATINAAQAVNGTITCPVGTYLTGPLLITKSVRWQGLGTLSYNESSPFTGCALAARSDIGSGTVTMTIATSIISDAGITPVANEMVYFETTGALPTGLLPHVPYFVVGSSITAGTYKVSATSGGSAITLSGTQSGIHTRFTDLVYQYAASEEFHGSIFRDMSFKGNARAGRCLHINDMLNGTIDHVAITDCQTGIYFEGVDDSSNWTIRSSVFRNNIIGADHAPGPGGQNMFTGNVFLQTVLQDIGLRWNNGAGGGGGNVIGNHFTGNPISPAGILPGIVSNTNGLTITGNTMEGVNPWVMIPLATAPGTNAGRGHQITSNQLINYLNVHGNITCDTHAGTTLLDNCTTAPPATLQPGTALKSGTPADLNQFTIGTGGQETGGSFVVSTTTAPNTITMKDPALLSHAGAVLEYCSPGFVWANSLAPTAGPPVLGLNIYVSQSGVCGFPNVNGQ